LTPEGRWRAFSYAELPKRNKVSLDLFWLRDESLDDSAGLKEPDVIASDFVEDFRAVLLRFALGWLIPVS
jgi:type I restriction enzyme M protein